MTHQVEAFAAHFADRLRGEQRLYGRRGLHQAKHMVGSIATDLEETAREWLDEEMTLEEASRVSGYSYSALQHMVADGAIPNAGQKGRPRIRRRDLPRKPEGGEAGIDFGTGEAAEARQPDDPGFDLVEDELAYREQRGGNGI